MVRKTIVCVRIPNSWQHSTRTRMIASWINSDVFLSAFYNSGRSGRFSNQKNHGDAISVPVKTRFSDIHNQYSDIHSDIHNLYSDIHRLRSYQMCDISSFYDFSGASRFHIKCWKNEVPNLHTFECYNNEMTKWLLSSIRGCSTNTKTFIYYNDLGPKISWEQLYWHWCGHSVISELNLSTITYPNRKYLSKSLVYRIHIPQDFQYVIFEF